MGAPSPDSDTKGQLTGQAASQDSAEYENASPALTQGGPEKDDPTTAPEDKREYPSKLAQILILGPVTLTYFLFFLDLAVLSTATPAITTEFNSLVDVGWYGGAYQLGSSALQPLTGKIFRHFSIKASFFVFQTIKYFIECWGLTRIPPQWTYMTFFSIFMIGSLLCGAAQSSTMFIIGRTIAGIGSSGISNGSLTIIAAVLPPGAQAQVMGINIGFGQLGLALGPIIGGCFTDFVSWRWCFYINLPIGAGVAILLLLFNIPEPEVKPPARQVLGTAIKALDLPGFALISPAAVMFLLGLQFGGNEYAWSSSVVIGLLVGAGATLVVFLVWEYRQGDGAMVPFSMLTHRIIWSAAGNMFFLLASILIADFYIAIYFQGVLNDSPLMSGVHMLPTTLGIVMFTMISAILTERFGYYLPCMLAGGAISAIGYGLLSLLSPTTSAGKWIGYQVFYGVGGGLMATGGYIAIQSLVPAHQIPTAMAIVIFCQNMGGAVFLVAANAIFSNTLRHQLSQRESVIGLSPDVIVNAGVRSIRDLVSGNELAAVLQAYSNSVDTVMYLGIGASIATFTFAWGLGWKDIRKERKLNEIRAAKPEDEERKAGSGSEVEKL